MRDLAAFCHFWGMTPAEMRALRIDEWRALHEYQLRYQREEREAIERLRNGGA